MQTQSRSVDAPAGLGIAGVIGVPEGDPLEMELRLESVVDGVLVTGTVRARAAGECVRCLEPAEQPLDVEFQELFLYPDVADERGADRGKGDGEDEEPEELRIEGDLIDLEPVVRDAVVLELPLQPVCREDCPGLCPDCGACLADDPEHRHTDAVDPRWAALQGLTVAPEHSGAGDDNTDGADGAENQEK
ncbi:YceD family protein [Mangrovactinospora gilvigrisea]|nr:DUF177 domain-containing protein [Mangrovactinospora gilvigrisea]